MASWNWKSWWEIFEIDTIPKIVAKYKKKLYAQNVVCACDCLHLIWDRVLKLSSDTYVIESGSQQCNAFFLLAFECASCIEHGICVHFIKKRKKPLIYLLSLEVWNEKRAFVPIPLLLLVVIPFLPHFIMGRLLHNEFLGLKSDTWRILYRCFTIFSRWFYDLTI